MATDARRRLLWDDTRGRVRVPWLVLLPLVAALIASALAEAIAGDLPLPLLAVVASGAPAVVAVALVLASRRLLNAPYGLTGYGLALDRTWLRDLGAGLAIGAVAVSLPFLLGIAAGRVEIVETLDPGELALWPGLLAYAFAMACTALWEELLLRGVLLRNTADGLARRLAPRHAIGGAIALSAVVFGLPHLAQPAHPALILTWILAGAVLGLLYVVSGSLGLVIGAHAAFNITSNLLFARQEVPGIDGLSVLLRVEVDPGQPLLALGGLLDAAGFVVLGLLGLLWLRRSRGPLAFRVTPLEGSEPVPYDHGPAGPRPGTAPTTPRTRP